MDAEDKLLVFIVNCKKKTVNLINIKTDILITIKKAFLSSTFSLTFLLREQLSWLGIVNLKNAKHF